MLGALGGLLLGATALTISGIGLVIAGPLAAVLGGAGIGAVTGGLAGALAGLGVSEDDARQYEERVEAGDILVVVAAGEREAEARWILEGGAYEPARRDEVGECVAVEDEAVDYRTAEGRDITSTPRE